MPKGYVVELVAAEPLVADPVAIAWDYERTVRTVSAELLGSRAPLRLRMLAMAAASEAARARGKELWQLFPPQEPQTKRLRPRIEQLVRQARELLQQQPGDVLPETVAVRLLAL